MNKTILIFILSICLGPCLVHAQAPVRPELTIAEQKWFERNGFNHQKYQWDNEDANFNLDIARKYFEYTRPMQIGGIASLVVGMPIFFAGVSKTAWGDGPGLLIMGATMVFGGISFSTIGGLRIINANKNLNRAIQIIGE